jgi:hypothetical protein
MWRPRTVHEYRNYLVLDNFYNLERFMEIDAYVYTLEMIQDMLTTLVLARNSMIDDKYLLPATKHSCISYSNYSVLPTLNGYLELSKKISSLFGTDMTNVYIENIERYMSVYRLLELYLPNDVSDVSPKDEVILDSTLIQYQTEYDKINKNYPSKG